MADLAWKIATAPTGKYKSFEKRAWPSADFKGTDRPAVYLRCADEYTKQRADSGQHAEIEVRVADHSPGNTFSWKLCKKRAATLQEAKQIAANVLSANPHFAPKVA